MGRPLKCRNVPECSVVISRRLHFRVLCGINQYQPVFKDLKLVWTGVCVLDFSSTLLWKPVSEPVFIYQKPVYTRKYSKIRWSEMAPEHPGMFQPLRGRHNIGIDNSWLVNKKVWIYLLWINWCKFQLILPFVKNKLLEIDLTSC